MSRILNTGIATLDIINHVDHYPEEDEELRVLAQETRPGGNAANSACVLSQLGHQVSLLCTLAEDAAGEQIRRELQTHTVMTAQIVTLESAHTPTSYIILNRANGSRTIVHYRDLPELRADDFPYPRNEHYDWFHFEGRNIEVTEQVLCRLIEQRVDQPISIEIEKSRPGVERLYDYADILLFSRAFALQQGYTCPDELFDDLRQQGISANLVCSWAEQGAWACDCHGNRYHQPAFAPEQIIDTLGAGDTFNAGLIHALLEGRSLDAALKAGCELAGHKVGQSGFANLNRSALE